MDDIRICANCLTPLPSTPQSRRFAPSHLEWREKKLVHRSIKLCEVSRLTRYAQLLHELAGKWSDIPESQRKGYWWAVVKLPNGNLGFLDERPALAKIYASNPYTLTWEGGGMYTSRPGGFYVDRFYDASDYPHWHNVTVQYYRDYPVKSASGDSLPMSAGWIAPGGEFYPCLYAEHDAVGERIAALYYGTCNRKDLERNGWLSVTPDGYVYGYSPIVSEYAEGGKTWDMDAWMSDGRPMTNAQVETLFSLSTAPDNDRFVDSVQWRKKILEAAQRANRGE